jgi:F-type H+-transporting ATPase subunit b
MRTPRRPVQIVLFVLPLFLCFAPPEGSVSSGLKDIMGKTINFVILFGCLTFLLRRPIRKFLERRSAEISQSLQDAEKARIAAAGREKQTEERLASLEEEVEKIKIEAEAAGLREKSRIKELTDKEVDRIRRFAQQEIEIQLKAAIHELKEFTAELATHLAEERLKKTLTPGDQKILIDRSIGQLAELYEKSTSS